MVGTTGGAVLIIINILFACLLGIAAGGLTSLALRRSWTLKSAVLDAALAAIIALVTALAISAIDSSRGIWQSRVSLVLGIAVSGVILKHVVGVMLSPSH